MATNKKNVPSVVTTESDAKSVPSGALSATAAAKLLDDHVHARVNQMRHNDHKSHETTLQTQHDAMVTKLATAPGQNATTAKTALDNYVLARAFVENSTVTGLQQGATSNHEASLATLRTTLINLLTQTT